MDISHLHSCKKAFVAEMKKNLDLYHVLFAFIEDGHQGQQFKVYHWHDKAQCLHITLVRPIMASHLHSWGITFAFCILLKIRKDEKGMK